MGEPAGDAGEVAEMGRGERALGEDGEDDGRVEAEALEQPNEPQLEPGVGLGRCGLHPRGLEHEHLVDLGDQPGYLRAGGRSQKGDASPRP
jgi:hypothetical protein